jgi:hypothetical protein
MQPFEQPVRDEGPADCMSISLLRDLALLDLPAIIERAEDIDALRSLVAGGMIKADIPEPVRRLGEATQPPATVTGITRLGRSMLRHRLAP